MIKLTNEGALVLDFWRLLTINCCGCKTKYFPNGWFDIWIGNSRAFTTEERSRIGKAVKR